MDTTRIENPPELRRAGRRFGYGVAIVVNVAMLIVVPFILDWGWLPFLTDEFTEVVPLISLSLIASIVANLVYEFNDTTIVKSTGQILVNLITVLVSYRIYQVFPFDFTAYELNWEIVARVVLILAMIGAGIGAIVEGVKLASDVKPYERGTNRRSADL